MVCPAEYFVNQPALTVIKFSFLYWVVNNALIASNAVERNKPVVRLAPHCVAILSAGFEHTNN